MLTRSRSTRFAERGARRPPSVNRPRSARAGFTLFELVLVLALTGIVLGLVSAIGTRLQRQLADSESHIQTAEQLAVVSALLPLDVRSLSPSADDIRTGEARDSSLELRSIVATAVTCSAAADSLIVAPYLLAGGRQPTFPAQFGDTLWVLVDTDTAESWRAVSIRSVRSMTGACRAVSDAATRSVLDLDHLIGLQLHDSVPADAGSIVRITRPIRYSFYRSSDGHWYLGLRTWNTAVAQFNGIQPLSGPYAPPALDATRIEYYDEAGNRLTSGMGDTRSIARIEWLVESESSGGRTPIVDSVRVAVAIRNRR